MSASLCVAVIGCGYFATNHLKAWKRLPGVEIAGVCDIDAGKAQSAAERARAHHGRSHDRAGARPTDGDRGPPQARPTSAVWPRDHNEDAIF